MTPQRQTLLAALAAVAWLWPFLAGPGFTAGPGPVDVNVADKEVGIGYGNITDNTNAFDLVVNLVPPENKTIASSEKHDDDGDIIWQGPTKTTLSDPPKRVKHTWTGAGVLANLEHQVRFHGTFKGFEGGSGTLPEFDVGVVDLDIDVDCTGARQGEHWPPTGSLTEDKKEDEPYAGVGVEPGMLPGTDYPAAIDMESLVRPYKILRVSCQPRWHESDSQIGELYFQLLGWGGSACELYDPDTGHKVTILPVPTSGLEKDLAIVTNDGFLSYGSTTITAYFTWDSQKVKVATGASDVVRVYPIAIIEADIVDRPPQGATYASGIDPDSLTVALNDYPKAVTKTTISEGIHIRYETLPGDLLSGTNTVRVMVWDRAKNETSPDPFTWTFQSP